MGKVFMVKKQTHETLWNCIHGTPLPTNKNEALGVDTHFALVVKGTNEACSYIGHVQLFEHTPHFQYELMVLLHPFQCLWCRSEGWRGGRSSCTDTLPLRSCMHKIAADCRAHLGSGKFELKSLQTLAATGMSNPHPWPWYGPGVILFMRRQ